MAPPASVVVDLLALATSFALGFIARDVSRRGGNKPGPSQQSRAAAVKKSVSIPRPKEELKMVLCVNDALKMGKGKIGAQCAHAAVGVVQKYRSRNEVAFKQWEYCGQAKIALRISDDTEMDELAEQASNAGLLTYIVCDAGRTQIAAGSQTVLAIGPAPKSSIDKITGHLKLL